MPAMNRMTGLSRLGGGKAMNTVTNDDGSDRP